MDSHAPHTGRYDRLEVRTYASEEELGRAAAREAARGLRAAVAARHEAHLMLATGNSQLAFLRALRREPDVPWSAVQAYHLDEYVGLPADHPAAFRRFLRQHLIDHVPVAAFHGIDGEAEPEAERQRYAALLDEVQLDVACIGVGENGHIAFNEPGSTDLTDAERVRFVRLDERSRRQQVDEGHFASLDEVPAHALTVTIPTIVSARRVLVVVPEARKAPAIRQALHGPIDASCPASVLRRTDAATLFLDPASASQLG